MREGKDGGRGGNEGTGFVGPLFVTSPKLASTLDLGHVLTNLKKTDK